LITHKAEATRRWISELIAEMWSKGFAKLAVIDPSIHPSDQVNAVINLFDGEIKIKETEDRTECKKTIS
jgi:hypothetical protein